MATSDGSLIFDTGINTKDFEHGTHEIRKKAEDAAKRVEVAVKAAEEAAEKAANETDAKAKKAAEKTAQYAKRTADKAIAEAKRVNEELTQKMNKIAKNQKELVSGMNTAAKGTAAGIVAAGTAVVGVGVKYNSEIEQYTAGFKTMLGSAEKADALLGNLKSFAEKTPFEMSDLASASTTLLAFGENVEDLMPDLKMLGDISLGNKEKFNGLALVFGQVKSQGKLMGQDLLQMINQGFNPLQVISKKTGESMSSLKDKMSKGEISFEMVADAMRLATKEGGQFYNAMETQSKTFAGQASTLADGVNSLFGEMSEGVSKELTETILPMAIDKVEELKQAWADGTLQQSIKTVSTLLIGTGGAIGALNIGVLVTDIQNVIKLGKSYETVTKAGAAAQKILNKEILMNPYALAAAAVIALTAGVIAYTNSLKDAEAELLIDKTKEQIEAWDDLKTSIQQTASASLAEIDRTKELSEELKVLADENGNVLEKDRDRVKFILGELNAAIGTEYNLIDGRIEKNKELMESIDLLIAKKRAEAYVNANENAYQEALAKRKDNSKALAETLAKIEEIKSHDNSNALLNEWLIDGPQLRELEKTAAELDRILKEQETIITEHESNVAAVMNGSAESIEKVNSQITFSFKSAKDATAQELKEQANQAQELYEYYLQQVKDGTINIDNQLIKDAEQMYHNALIEYSRAGNAIPLGFVTGIKAMGGTVPPEIEAVLNNAFITAETYAETNFSAVGNEISNGIAEGMTFTPTLQNRTAWLMNRILTETKSAGQINSPSKLFEKEAGKEIPAGVAVGIDKYGVLAEKAAGTLMADILHAAQKAADINSPAGITEEGVGKWLSLGVAEGITKNSDEAVKAFNSMLEKLEYQRNFDIINEEQYYTELERLRDKYFTKGSDEWLSYTEQIYEYQKKALETQKKDIEALYTDVADHATKKIEEVISKQEAYQKKLNSFSNLFDVNTVHMGDDTFTYYSMHDFSKDTALINEFSKNVEALKSRLSGLGIGEDVIGQYMSEFDALDVTTAMQFIKGILSGSDSDLLKNIEGYALQRATSEKASTQHYAPEMEKAVEGSIEYMKEKLQEAGFTDIPEDFFISGQISAQRFGEAFISEIEKQMEIIQSKIAEFNAGLNLNVQGMTIMQTAAAGGGTTNNYSAVYNVQTSGESETATLTALRNQQLLNEMRGGW